MRWCSIFKTWGAAFIRRPTMAMAMEAAAENGKKYFVLDRVDPINGVTIDGPVLAGEPSFVGYHSVPLRYGMTIGELAKMFSAERRCAVNLTVIPLENWRRDFWMDQTGLPWTNPSPNMRNLIEAILYPGIGLLESAVSVGRGTDTPFELVGAPYVKDTVLARELNGVGLPGVEFIGIQFTPTGSGSKENCVAVYLLFSPTETSATLSTLDCRSQKLCIGLPGDFDPGKMAHLLKHEPTLVAIKADKPLSEIHATWGQTWKPSQNPGKIL